MVKILVFCLLLALCCCIARTQNVTFTNETSTLGPVTAGPEIDVIRQRLDNQTVMFEKGLKNIIKVAMKNIMPMMMNFNDGKSTTSTKCLNGLMKYIAGIATVKVWAIKMIDATSKLPAGLFDGTLSEFGAFDQCLEQYLPTRNGKIEFWGKYCAIEARPIVSPTPKNFSIAKQKYAEPLDTIAAELRAVETAFYHLKVRLGVCVPSTCTLEDIQGIGKRVAEQLEVEVEIPQCYVKEGLKFEPVHFAVFGVLGFLLLLCIIGSFVEYAVMETPQSERKLNPGQQVFICFSFISNFRRLISASKGSEELKALHGLRALSIAWVILGHTYVWTNFQLLQRVKTTVSWANSLDMGPILNGWLSVEQFFFLSGFLTSYAAMKMLPITKGKINVPMYIIRRYLRLTPPLLMAMGLAFFMPLVSSGPFWYERIDPEIRACTKNWWQSIIYISNWFGMGNICMHTTWYLSADFQLHLITIVFLFGLYRMPKLTLSLISVFILACCTMVGTLTYLWELPPIILISSGNSKQIEDTLNVVHMNTFTHAGPYYVGIILGYLTHRYKNVRINKFLVVCGWIISAAVCLTSLYGAHRWNIGEHHGPLLTAVYAGLHRTTFTIGVAWVAFACITGHGGLVNRILSSSILAPVSRLTFMIYLLHCLVIWTRIGSQRERFYLSHYNEIYEYFPNLVLSIAITVPFYLLLEAPLTNLERLVFSRAAVKHDEKESHRNGHLLTNMADSSVGRDKIEQDVVPLEMTSVKYLENGVNNLAFNGDSVVTKKD